MNIFSKTEWLYNKLLISFQFLIQIFFRGGAKELARTFWDRRNGREVWNFTKIFNKAEPTDENCTPSSYPLDPGYIPLLSPDELASCSLAMSPITFPRPLPTSRSVKRPLSYYSFIVQVQLVKNYPYNLNSYGRRICSIPPGILRIKISG